MADDPYRKRFLVMWPLGLLAFAAIVWIGLPLDIPGAPGGILAHQAAGTGAAIDSIQQAWADAGLTDRARYAMIGDIVFITIYGLGSWYGGLHFMADARPRIRRMGMVLVAAAAIFIATDYAETFSQIVQLFQQRGSDNLAGLAATVRPVKVVACLVTFFGIIAVLVVRRFARAAA